MQKRFKAVVIACTAAALIAAPGCSILSSENRLDARVRSGLADSIERAQDTLWDSRHEIAADGEAALAELSFVGDIRPLYADPTLPMPVGSYRMIALEQRQYGTAVTFVAETTATAGGIAGDVRRTGYACYTLVFAANGSRIDTEPAECADEEGHGLPEATPGEADVSALVINVDDLELRRSVTGADHEPLPCQCSSGGTCDCPGG